jgi:hypothetical protein
LDELGEPLNSCATHPRLIESGSKVRQTPFIKWRERDEAPNPGKGEFEMKGKRTLALAAATPLLIVGTFPNPAVT